MLSYRDLIIGFRQLEISPENPIIVHASLSSFGEIRGGVETLFGALLNTFSSILTPTFTYKTMIIPEVGPENNGIDYGSGKSLNKMAEFFSADLPADRLMGVLAEKIRTYPKAVRSNHPILSFAGINLPEAIHSQSLENPLAPIQWLHDHEGAILLLGVDQTVNTSIHLAEQLAGRKSFIRWGLTRNAILECPNFPGCSNGFNKVEHYLSHLTMATQIGKATIKVISISELFATLIPIIQKDLLAFLCEQQFCDRCNSIRFDSQLLANVKTD